MISSFIFSNIGLFSLLILYDYLHKAKTTTDKPLNSAIKPPVKLDEDPENLDFENETKRIPSINESPLFIRN